MAEIEMNDDTATLIADYYFVIQGLYPSQTDAWHRDFVQYPTEFSSPSATLTGRWLTVLIVHWVVLLLYDFYDFSDFGRRACRLIETHVLLMANDMARRPPILLG